VDPRIDRTQRHVLDCASALLAEGGAEAVTFSSVARVARVSRATLYRHWQTRELLLAAVITRVHGEDPVVPGEDLDPEAFLLRFLRGVRAGFEDPATQAALGATIGHAVADEASRQTLVTMAEQRHAALEAGWGPIDAEECARVVGPIFFRIFLAKQPVSDEFLQALVEQAAARRDTAPPPPPPVRSRRRRR
jgi:AcrR family transcriptional regulator